MIGERLKRAREALGFSLRELEARINGLVSAQAIGKYERNEMMPGSTAFLALAKVLGVTPEYLLSESEIQLTGVDFRKATHAGVKEERAVVVSVLDQVERYLELEELMPPSGKDWSALKWTHTVKRIEDAEKAAEKLRNDWKLGVDPIPTIVELLEERGIKVVVMDLPESVSGSKAFVRRPNQPDIPVIVVNKKHNGERQRFTLAHELAHVVLKFNQMSEVDEEKAADRFAGAFLMHKEMMQQLLGQHRKSISLGELIELKQIFRVSVASLVVRSYQLDMLSKASYGRLWSEIKAKGWNTPQSQEPHRLQPEKPQRMERICLRAVAEGMISESRAAELLQISVRKLDAILDGRVAE